MQSFSSFECCLFQELIKLPSFLEDSPELKLWMNVHTSFRSDSLWLRVEGHGFLFLGFIKYMILINPPVCNILHLFFDKVDILPLGSSMCYMRLTFFYWIVTNEWLYHLCLIFSFQFHSVLVMFSYDATIRHGLGDYCNRGTLFILCMTTCADIHVDSTCFSFVGFVNC